MTEEDDAPDANAARQTVRTRAGGAKKRPTRYQRDVALSEDARRGLSAQKKGRFTEAATLLRAAYRTSPESVDVAINLGAVELQLGRTIAARSAFERGVSLAPTDARVLRDAAIGLCAMGHLDEAARLFERATTRDPSMVGAWLGLARARRQLGDRDGAVRAGRAAIERAHDDASTWIELHLALFDDRATGALRDEFVCASERGYALAPRSEHAALLFAGALRITGDREASERVLRASGLGGRGVADALRWVNDERERSGARVFATKQEGWELALDAAPTKGVVAEFGVRFGTSTRALARRGDVVHGFDSFEGLPEAWNDLEPGAFSTSGAAPSLPDNVVLHVGWFDATAPAFAASLDGSPKLVHIDSDLYSSAACVLDALGAKLARGTVLVFDEVVGNERWREDEHRALCEAIERFDWQIEWLAVSWITGQGVLRLR
ncbi:MAG: tetratricopeptide repeat protein [Myxococcales bacterium]|nr:tetratricopeptide repeat protein [Myxococcales bacterium]